MPKLQWLQLGFFKSQQNQSYTKILVEHTMNAEARTGTTGHLWFCSMFSVWLENFDPSDRLEVFWVKSSQMYGGVCPRRAVKVKTIILKSIRRLNDRQCKTDKIRIKWAPFKSLATVFCPICRWFKEPLLKPIKNVVALI